MKILVVIYTILVALWVSYLKENLHFLFQEERKNNKEGTFNMFLFSTFQMVLNLVLLSLIPLFYFVVIKG